MAKAMKKRNVMEIQDDFDFVEEVENSEEELDFDDDMFEVDDEVELDFEEDDEEEFEEEIEENDDDLEFDDDDEEEDEPEEEIVEVKKVKPTPTPKPVTQAKPKKQKVVSSKPSVEEKPAKKEKQPSGKVRKQNKVQKEHATYEKLMETVTSKVDAYDKIMEERALGKSKALPQSTAISKELFVKLLVAKASEENDKGMKQAMQKAMVSMGFDSEDSKDALSNYRFKETEMSLVYAQMFELMYDILSIGSGFPLFKNEDCNSTLEGRWTEEVLKDNAHLNTDKATYIESFLKLSCKSTAPVSKKHQGKINSKGQFVPENK